MTVLLFLYIFNFYLIKGISVSESAIVIGLFLVIYSFINKEYLNNTVHKLLSNYNKVIVIFLGVLIFLSIFWPIACGTYDFSYMKVLIHQLIIIEIGFLVVSFFSYKRISIINPLINCFVVQSLIQLLCFLSPELTKITDIFRSNELIAQRVASYNGFRGLAISGTNFFGLAVAYSLIFLVLVFYWKKWNHPNYIKILFSLFLTFGALSAGRTAAIGVIGFWIYLIFELFSYLKFKSQIKFVLGTLAIFFVLFFVAKGYIFNMLETNETWQKMYIYLFQFLNNGKIDISNVSSLNHMFRDMYFDLSPSQVLIGDGLYIASNGLYYMNTDVGFMRNVLFWGSGCTIILYIYEIVFLYFRANTIKSKFFSTLVLIMLFIFEFKGQTLSFLIIAQSILVLTQNNLNELC